MKKLLLTVMILYFFVGCNSSIIDRLNPGLIAKVDNHKIYLDDIKERATEDNDKNVKLTKPMILFYLNEIIKEIVIKDEFKKLGLKLSEVDKKEAPYLKKLNKSELERWLIFKKLKSYIVRKITPPSAVKCKAYYKKHKKEFNDSEKVKLKYIIFEEKQRAEKFYKQVKKTNFDTALKKSGLYLTYKGILNVKNIPDDIKKQIDYTDKGSVWIIQSENKYFYVIKIEDFFRNILPFNVAKEYISKKILEENRAKLFDLWLRDTIKKRNIIIYYNKLN